MRSKERTLLPSPYLTNLEQSFSQQSWQAQMLKSTPCYPVLLLSVFIQPCVCVCVSPKCVFILDCFACGAALTICSLMLECPTFCRISAAVKKRIIINKNKSRHTVIRSKARGILDTGKKANNPLRYSGPALGNFCNQCIFTLMWRVQKILWVCYSGVDRLNQAQDSFL